MTSQATGRESAWWWVPGVGMVVTIALQLMWPLTPSGPERAELTAATVVIFAATSLAHALIHRGVGWTVGFVAITIGWTWLVEAVGVASGMPFGTYSYGSDLGSTVLGVPWLIPLAWLMFAYPALWAGQVLTRQWAAGNRLVGITISAWTMMAWDFFLDPQMVGEGYWKWSEPFTALPGLDAIPATNFAGWFATAWVLFAVMNLLPRDDSALAAWAVPTAALVWTWMGGIVANLLFLHRWGPAWWGGIALGAVVVAIVWTHTRREEVRS